MDAWEKVLDALFEGVTLTSRQAVIILDLTVMWGNAFKARCL